MKKFRKNNKGFTLVELIIVIAIIAVVSAVAAPQYIKYVENSRVSMDENARDELKHAVEIAISDETVYDALPATGSVTLTYLDGDDAFGGTCDSTLSDKVAEALPVANINFAQSKTYDGKTITVTVTAASGSYTVGAGIG